MTEKYYQGKKVLNVQPFDAENSYCLLDGTPTILDSKWLFDTKELSLKHWKPVLLQDIIKYHSLKFGNQDFMLQLDKLEEEVIELLGAIQRVKENKEIGDDDVFDTLMGYVQDEYGDVIMAGSQLLNIQKAMEHTFEKLALRSYPDGFKHIEK